MANKLFFVLDKKAPVTDLGPISYGPFENLDDAIKSATVLTFKGPIEIIGSDGAVVKTVSTEPNAVKVS